MSARAAAPASVASVPAARRRSVRGWVWGRLFWQFTQGCIAVALFLRPRATEGGGFTGDYGGGGHALTGFWGRARTIWSWPRTRDGRRARHQRRNMAAQRCHVKTTTPPIERARSERPSFEV